MIRRRTQSIPLLPEYPSVGYRVAESTDIWARDLRSLFEHAKERFGDVSWESEDVEDEGRIWGHKAVIYARAPKAFKDRYFISRPFSRSPTSLRSPSPQPSPNLHPSRASSPPSSFRKLSPISSLSVQSITSEGTIRATANGDGVLRLTHGDTPEMFQAQLEWLYTGEGFGDVVEWIEDDPGSGGSLRDSLGRRGDMADRRDRLGQDLTYMWRSKLYCDVLIHLALQEPLTSGSEDSDDSTDSLTSTAIFTSHRFILASRSSYFASVLLNPSSFRTPSTADIHLSTPPITPAALHFCLGYMYAGHLDFSNRTFDLLTAFEIHRAAAYLQLDTLLAEIEARIVHDFCHGLDYDRCHCRRCPARAARVWRFAHASDVGAVVLGKRARVYLSRGWDESWGREVGSAERTDRDELVQDVISTITPTTVISAFRSIDVIRARIDTGVRGKGRDASAWADGLEEMLDAVEEHTRRVLIRGFLDFAEGTELWDLLSGKGFAGDLLERLVTEIVNGVGTANGYTEGPQVYQALVSAILLKVHPETHETVLPARSRHRQHIEAAREGVLGHMRRRWMQIRDIDGFGGLENWSLKEISDEIDVPVKDLVMAPSTTPHRPGRFAFTPKTAPRPTLPRTTSQISSSVDFTNFHTAAPVQPSTARTRSTTPPDPTGLKRLRLSTSASTSSMVSFRSISANRVIQRSSLGPQARSPTAERPGTTVPIGRTRPSSPTPGPKVALRSMSGPPKPLVSRPSPKLDNPDRMSVDSDATSTTTSSGVTRPKLTPKKMPQGSGSSSPASRPTDSISPGAGPSRMRTTSASTTISARSKAASTLSMAPMPTRSKSPSPVDTATARVALRPSTKAELITRPRTCSVSTVASTRSVATGKTGAAPHSSKTITIPKPFQLSSSRHPKTPKSQPHLTPAKPVAPKPSKPLSPTARLRTTSTASTTSKTSIRNRLPPPSMPLPLFKPSVRSPSSSTDEPPEARTPFSSQIIDPVIRREGSEGSELSRPRSPSRATAPIGLPRPTRKSSSSSSRSTASALRFHPASAFDPPQRLLESALPLTRKGADGLDTFTGAGLAFHIGIPCIVSLSQTRARFKAQVKYIGHMRGSRGPWVGIEVEDLERFGVDTFPTGSREGIHYFHLSPNEAAPDLEAKAARQRRLDLIRESMSRKSSKPFGLGLGLGRPVETRAAKRSISPFTQDWAGLERPRALFVRPSEVVFILGAE